MKREDALDIVESLVISGLPVHPKARDGLMAAIGELNPKEAARIDSAAAFRDLAEAARKAQLQDHES